MKRLTLLLALVLSMGLSIPSFAYDSKTLQDANISKMADQFNVLSKHSYCVPAVTEVVTPTNTTATYAYSIAYCPTTITPPVKVRIQNLGSNKVYYCAYSFNSTLETVTITTGSDSYLINPGEPYIGTYSPALDYGEAVEMIFYQTPTICFGGGGSLATFTIDSFTQEADPYQ